MSARGRWQLELEKIRAAHRGMLKPKHVVAAASNPESPLHGKFEWDDGKAAEAYRLQQAEQLIRIVVTKLDGTDEPVRAYVSLSSDRMSRGGFRAIVDVLSDRQLLAVLIEDSKAELISFQQRYDRLRKVAKFKPLMREIGKVTRRRRR